MMKKQSLLKFLNIILVIAFCLVAISIILYRWGPNSIRWDEGLYEIHETFGLIFIFVGLLHLVLNWTWIQNTYLKRRK
ncbi:DUF4405 domain-containing protein [bacterium]|nr:DUF4405 domain-containing protein [bacterium]RQV95055.1 MAG: DUF4405 domain-containing protein [bacterium]